MNERIKELAEQAEQYAYTNNVGMQCQLWRDKFQAKFAELIVRDCINEIHVAGVGNLTGKEYYLDKVAEHIEKHFGVE